ncbi:MAG: hypothetical protein IJ640_01045 [Prevotella sp.]|nr:hypothetical protein [Prevotella sp.]
MKVEIDIDSYLSEDEKKELARESFKELCKCALLPEGAMVRDAESEIARIAGNAAYAGVIEEMNSLYNTDMKAKIADNIKDILNGDSLRFEAFYQARHGYGQDGLARTIMNECIKQNRAVIEEKVKKAIEEFDYSPVVANEVCNKIENLADDFGVLAYKLRDMIIPKAKQQE